MLDLYKCTRVFACRAYKIILILTFSFFSLHSSEYKDAEKMGAIRLMGLKTKNKTSLQTSKTKITPITPAVNA